MGVEIEQDPVMPSVDATTPESRDLESPEFRRELIRRICESDGFRRSRRLCEFLQYICEKAIEGDVAEIHERQIAIDVFERPDGSYDPSLDNTVRVQARSLRQKLADYFRGPGADEPVLVDVPKGGYIPTFTVRAPDSGRSHATLSLTAGRPGRHFAMPVWAWGVIAVVLALAVSLTMNAYLLLRPARPAAIAGGSRAKTLAGKVIEPGKPTVVVVPDTGYVIAQVLTGKDLSLQNYGEAAYRSALFEDRAEPGRRGFWGYMISRRFTDISSMDFYGRLVSAVPPELGKLELKHPRTLSLQEFSGRNVILLGSPRSNPWVEAFDEHLSFRFASAGQGQEYVRNANPRGDEPASFSEERTKLGVGRVIGVLNLIPNPYPPGRVLIVAGANAAVTDALGIVALTSHGLEKLSSALEVEDASELERVEVVISAEVLGDAVKDWKVLASRTENAP